MGGKQEYWVLFQDKVRGDISPERLRAAFKDAFGVDEAVLDKVFCGEPVVIKPRADAMTAQEFKERIEAFGGVCWFEPREGDEGYQDRRQQRRRLQFERRDVRRDHAILPDRRAGGGRRDEDQD